MTRSDGSGPDVDWWRGAVIYQVYPRSFQDSTGTGTGDLAGITARLDHIARLGVDAIWIAPFFTSPMADMGYDVADYCAVDPMFGSIDDFRDLVDRAHDLGLKVVIDQVLSHSSDQHPWFLESRQSRDNPRADWYVWADPRMDGTAPNNWLSVFGGPAWEWDGVRKQYYLHNFLASQPDLNFHNPQVQDALLEALRFWLDLGVDGFRLDTVNFYFHDSRLRSNPPARHDGGSGGIGADAQDTNPYGMQSHLYSKSQPENLDFLKRLRALLDEYPGATSMGEVGDARALDLVAAYTADGDKLHQCYTFDLLSPAFSAAHFDTVIRRFEAAVTDGWACWAFSNHDVVRHVSRWTEPGIDPARVAKFAATLLLCLRGSVCLYQGEELGLTEAELAYEDLRDPYGIHFWPAFKGRDGCRTPMVWDRDAPSAGFTAGTPWLPVPAAHLPLAAAAQENDQASVLNHYRAMLDFRRANPVLRDSAIEMREMLDNILCFQRGTGPGRLALFFNLDTEPVNRVLPDWGRGGAPVALPGFTGKVFEGTLTMNALDICCLRLP